MLNQTEKCISINLSNGRVKQLVSFIEKGHVPQPDRWTAWKLRVDIYSIFKPDLYEYLLMQPCPESKTIIKDIARAFPDQQYFLYTSSSSSPSASAKPHSSVESDSSKSHKKEFTYGEESLCRVLHAIAVYFPSFGYTQGMNIVVGFLLLVNGGIEEEAFWMFIKLATSPQFLMMGLYENYFPLIDLGKFLLDSKLKEILPAVHAHLRSTLEIVYEEWFLQWSITLFLDKFPLHSAIRFWDFIIASDSFFAVISLSLAILMELEEQILQLEDRGAFHMLFNSFSEENPQNTTLNVDRLIQQAKKIKITKKFTYTQVKLYLESPGDLIQSAAKKQLLKQNRYTNYFQTSDLLVLCQDIADSTFTIPDNYQQEIAESQQRYLRLIHQQMQSEMCCNDKQALSEQDLVEKAQIENEQQQPLSSRSEGQKVIRGSKNVSSALPSSQQTVIFMHPTRQFLPPIRMNKKENSQQKKDLSKIDSNRISISKQTGKNENEFHQLSQAARKKQDSSSVHSNPTRKYSLMHVTNLDYLEKEARSEASSSSAKSIKLNHYFFHSQVKSSQSQINHHHRPHSSQLSSRKLSAHSVSGSFVLKEAVVDAPSSIIQHSFTPLKVKSNMSTILKQKEEDTTIIAAATSTFVSQNSHFQKKLQENHALNSPSLGFVINQVKNSKFTSNNSSNPSQKAAHSSENSLRSSNKDNNQLDHSNSMNKSQNQNPNSFPIQNTMSWKGQMIISSSKKKKQRAAAAATLNSAATSRSNSMRNSGVSISSSSSAAAAADQPNQLPEFTKTPEYAERINNPFQRTNSVQEPIRIPVEIANQQLKNEIVAILGEQLEGMNLGESILRFGSSSRSKRQLDEEPHRSPANKDNQKQLQQLQQQHELPTKQIQSSQSSTSFKIRQIEDPLNVSPKKGNPLDKAKIEIAEPLLIIQSPKKKQQQSTPLLDQDFVIQTPFRIVSVPKSPFQHKKPSSLIELPTENKNNNNNMIIQREGEAIEYSQQEKSNQNIPSPKSPPRVLVDPPQNHNQQNNQLDTVADAQPHIRLGIKKVIAQIDISDPKSSNQNTNSNNNNKNIDPTRGQTHFHQEKQQQQTPAQSEQLCIQQSVQQTNDDMNMSGYINELPHHNISGFSQFQPQQTSQLKQIQNNSNVVITTIPSFRRDSVQQSQQQFGEIIQYDGHEDEQRDAISQVVQTTEREHLQEDFNIDLRERNLTTTSLSELSYNENQFSRSQQQQQQQQIHQQHSHMLPNKGILTTTRTTTANRVPGNGDDFNYPEISPFEKQRMVNNNLRIGQKPKARKIPTSKELAISSGVVTNTSTSSQQVHSSKNMKRNSLHINGNGLVHSEQAVHSSSLHGQPLMDSTNLTSVGLPVVSYDSKFNNNYLASTSHLHEIQEEIYSHYQQLQQVPNNVAENQDIIDKSLTRMSSSILSGKTNQTQRSHRITSSGIKVSGQFEDDDDQISSSQQSVQKIGKIPQPRRIIGSMAQKNLVSQQSHTLQNSDALHHQQQQQQQQLHQQQQLNQIPPRGRSSSSKLNSQLLIPKSHTVVAAIGLTSSDQISLSENPSASAQNNKM